MGKLRNDATKIFMSAIDAVKPRPLIQNKVFLENDILEVGAHAFNLREYERIYIIGAGKASAMMAKALEEILESKIYYGVISVKYGHLVECHKIKIMEAGHPVLDQNGLTVTDQILQLARGARERDLVICLISGGGSALLESLPSNIYLHDLQKVFELLLGCGSDIEEINTVRKHLSLVKGGQLARAIYPATCISIILSDVIGDPLDAIASGPTVPDPTTFKKAWDIIEKYNLINQLPDSVRTHLEEGVKGRIEDTLKLEDPIFGKVNNFIIGNNLLALKTAQEEAKRLGYNTLILTSRVRGEAREVAQVVASIAQEIEIYNLPIKKPACFLMGGETTVTLRGKGKGGRNQELALAALIAMEKVRKDYVIVSCGTDGTDGPTDAAGGMVDYEVTKNAVNLQLNPLTYLEENNAYPFLQKTGGLIKTGPTGTNVMDIILALIPKS